MNSFWKIRYVQIASISSLAATCLALPCGADDQLRQDRENPFSMTALRDINATMLAGTITGGSGDDNPLSGGASPDLIRGNSGNDTINGDGSKDYLYGDAGMDTINGGTGAGDFCDGGSETDTFVDIKNDGIFNPECEFPYQ